MRRESGSDTQRDEIEKWRAKGMERHDTETQREEIEKWRLKGMERHDTIHGERRSRNGVHER